MSDYHEPRKYVTESILPRINASIEDFIVCMKDGNFAPNNCTYFIKNLRLDDGNVISMKLKIEKLEND